MSNSQSPQSGKTLFTLAIIAVLCSLLATSMITAFEWDNVQGVMSYSVDNGVTIGNEQVEYNQLWEKYPPLKVENALGLPFIGENLFEGTITQHTERCWGSCESTIKINHAQNGVMIQDIRFYDITDGGKELIEFEDYQILVSDGYITEEVDDIRKDCTTEQIEYTESVINNETGENITQQMTRDETTCEDVKYGKKNVTKDLWIEYIPGTPMDKGEYTIRITGDKSPNVELDWQIKVRGRWTTEWAEWGTSTLSDDLVAYYRMDEDSSSLLDETFISGPATNSGGDNITGKIGSGYSLVSGSSDYIQLPADFRSTDQSGAMSFWWYTETSACSNKPLWAVSRSGVSEVLRFFPKTDCKMQLQHYINPANDAVTTNVTFANNTWYHLVIQSTGSAWEMWVNGAPVSFTVDAGSNSGDWINDMTGGTYTTGFSREYTGSAVYNDIDVDEYAYWNRTLNQTEVDELYNSGTGVQNERTDYYWTEYGLDNDLVSYYKLDSNSFLDETGTNNATNSGSTNTTGIIVDGRTVDGSSDYISVPNAAIDYVNNFTVSLWFENNGDAAMCLFGAQTAGASGLTIDFNMQSAGNIGASLVGGTGSSFASWTSNNNWNNIVTVWDSSGENLYVYLNGVLHSSDTSATASADARDFYLGARNIDSGTDFYFNGNLDEVGIWNASLNSSQVRALYNYASALVYGSSGDTSPTVTLNSPADASTETSNTVTFNATAIANAGSLVNMSLWTNQTSWSAKNTTTFVSSLTVQDNFETLGDGGWTLNGQDHAQTFTTTDSYTVTNLSIYAKIGGGSPTSATVQLTDTSGSVPNNVLDQCTMDLTGINSSFQWFTCNMNDNVTVTDATLYGIVVKNMGATNFIRWEADYTNGYADGAAYYYSGSWTDRGGDDFYFRTYYLDETTTSTQTWTRYVDELTLWNVEACDSNGDCSFASANYTVDVDSTAPSVNISSPSGKITNSDGNFTLLTNASDGGTLDTCWYAYNGTNTTYTCNTEIKVPILSSGSVYACANDSVGNENCTDATTFTWDITVNVLDYTGALITSPDIIITDASIDTNENPLVRDSQVLLNNLDTRTMEVQVNTSTSYNQNYVDNINFNTSQGVYNITMGLKQFNLNFTHLNGSFASCSGYWKDNETVGTNFTDVTNVTMNLINTTQDYVYVYFGWNITDPNDYRQFYEFSNDWSSAFDVNVSVIGDIEDTEYMKVIDEAGNPLEGALIKVYQQDASIGGGTYQLMGQRFTAADGITFFYFDNQSDTKIVVSKDGHDIAGATWNVQDESNTIDSPKIIQLEKSELTTVDNVYVYIGDLWFVNRSSDRNVTVYAPDRTEVKFTTEYKINAGQSNRTFTLDSYYFGTETLYSGQDFNSTGVSDIIIYIWVDGDLWGAITLDYRAGVVVDLLDETSGIDSTTRDRILFILLILIAGVASFLIQTERESVGKWAFLIGSVILASVAFSTFSNLMLASLFVMIVGLLRRFLQGE